MDGEIVAAFSNLGIEALQSIGRNGPVGVGALNRGCSSLLNGQPICTFTYVIVLQAQSSNLKVGTTLAIGVMRASGGQLEVVVVPAPLDTLQEATIDVSSSEAAAMKAVFKPYYNKLVASHTTDPVSEMTAFCGGHTLQQLWKVLLP
jgi:hypothetical protein